MATASLPAFIPGSGAAHVLLALGIGTCVRQQVSFRVPVSFTVSRDVLPFSRFSRMGQKLSRIR